MSHPEFTETYEQILNDTVPQTPGIIRSVALRELRLAAREFFEKSMAWVDTIEDVDAPAGEVDIDITDAAAETEVIAVLGVTYKDITTGKAVTPLPLLPARPTRSETSDRPRNFFVSRNPDHIRLYPYLQNAQTNFLDVFVALIPAFDSTTLSRQVTLKFYDALVNGYLARVYAHPNKPYSSPIMAQQLRHNFVRQIGYYMAQRKSGFSGGQNWTYPPGWGVRRLGGNG